MLVSMTSQSVRDRVKQVMAECQLKHFKKPLWKKIGPISAEEAASFRAHDEDEIRAWWVASESDVELLLRPRWFVEEDARTAGVDVVELDKELTKIEAENDDRLRKWRCLLNDEALSGTDLLDFLRSAWRIDRFAPSSAEPEPTPSQQLWVPLSFYFNEAALPK